MSTRSDSPNYEVDAAGDVVAVVQGGVATPFDPSAFGWLKADGLNDPGPADRQSLADIEKMSDFTVGFTEIRPFVPGPKATTHSWRAWEPGTAPPAALETDDGKGGGTRAYYDRLTDALGRAVERARGVQTPTLFLAFDFVSGQLITLDHPAPAAAIDAATIYLIDDGYGIKIGVTWSSGNARLRTLQTGNPRPLHLLAEVRGAPHTLESELWQIVERETRAKPLKGEWFERAPLLQAMESAGGTKAWLESLAPVRGFEVVAHS